MRIILTGATGLIGSRFVELMTGNHEIIPLSSKEVDITQSDKVSAWFSEREADILIHLAAKTDVDGCESDKEQDYQLINGNNTTSLDLNTIDTSFWEAKNTAFATNAIGTLNLYQQTQSKGIRFVYISTDFVFNGDGEFTESSATNPLNWYGMTKYFGETIIDTSKNLIARMSYPYGYKSPVKVDFVQKLIGLIKDNEKVSLIEDQIITPTFIDDIVHGLNFLISRNETGIVHLSGSSSESPFAIGNKIKESFGLATIIDTSFREDVYKDKAKRPAKSILINEKIKSFGFIPKTFDEGLALISGK